MLSCVSSLLCLGTNDQITISLTKTIKTSNDRDKERATIRYFERLFPGNRATLHKLFRAFKDLDMDRDGAITPSEICFRFNQVTGVELDQVTRALPDQYMFSHSLGTQPPAHCGPHQRVG